MERSDKLDHLVSQISTAQFADPFPPEYAGREQVELVLDRVTDLRLDVANLRACLVGIIGDQFAGLNARLAALEAK